MKKIWMMSLMLLAAGLFGFTWVPQAEAADPPSYDLVCRGGGNMTVSGIGYRGSAIDRLVILFEKLPIDGGDYRKVTPGHCAWPRRALNQNEPKRLHFLTREAAKINSWTITYQNKPNKRRGISGVSVGSGENWSRLSVEAKSVRVLIRAVREGRLFLLKVYNTNKGYMRITWVDLNG